MKPHLFVVLAALLAAAQPALAKKPPTPAAAPAQPDLAALIECRGTLRDFQALKAALLEKGNAATAGWTPLPRANPYMFEFALPAPVEAFGDATSHVAFTGDSVIAILDEADPRPLAHRLQLQTGLDTPQKALFGKEVRGDEVTGADGRKQYDSAVLSVSNVDTHPGKTLAGCSYDLDAIDDDASPAPDSAAPAAKP